MEENANEAQLYNDILHLGEDEGQYILRLGMNDFRRDPDYILYYINVAHLIITGLFPLVSLIVLNYLVYKHLVTRRKQVETLGNDL